MAWLSRHAEGQLSDICPTLPQLWLGAGDCLVGESRVHPCASHSSGPWQAAQPSCPGSAVVSPHRAPSPLAVGASAPRERIMLWWYPKQPLCLPQGKKNCSFIDWQLQASPGRDKNEPRSWAPPRTSFLWGPVMTNALMQTFCEVNGALARQAPSKTLILTLYFPFFVLGGSPKCSKFQAPPNSTTPANAP